MQAQISELFIIPPNTPAIGKQQNGRNHSVTAEVALATFQRLEAQVNQRQKLAAELAKLEEEIKGLELEPVSRPPQKMGLPLQKLVPVSKPTQQFAPTNVITPSPVQTAVKQATQPIIKKPASSLEPSWTNELKHAQEKVFTCFEIFLTSHLTVHEQADGIFTFPDNEAYETVIERLRKTNQELTATVKKYKKMAEASQLTPFIYSEAKACCNFFQEFLSQLQAAKE